MAETKKTKGPKTVYPDKPKSMVDLNYAYMGEFVEKEFEKGNITTEQIQEFQDKTVGKALSMNEVKKIWANIFYPELIKKQTLNERFAKLLK